MIFRRKKRTEETDRAESVVEPLEQEAQRSTRVADVSPTDATDDDTADDDTLTDLDPDIDVAALDAREWRTDGPFDISEVDRDDDDDADEDADDDADDDADEPDDEQPRIDLGSIIVTSIPGAELRLQVAEETQQIISVMLVKGDSALELGAYAAPRSGGLWTELRDEIIENATEAGGSAAILEGPFGVELRRLMPVTTPDGEQGYQPSRMWVVEGPRWLLRGIVYGQAALEDGIDPPVAELLTAFRQTVVRRGDEAMAPGDLLTLTLPQNLVAAEPDDRHDEDS